MTETAYRFIETLPNPNAYARLRAAVGWNELHPEAVATGLSGSQYTVCVYREQEIVGCGRVVGDGGIYFYVQDIIVHPDHQGQGLGDGIMRRIMAHIAARARPNCFIALMAAQGAEAFYTKYGFERRPADRPGMFLIWDE